MENDKRKMKSYFTGANRSLKSPLILTGLEPGAWSSAMCRKPFSTVCRDFARKTVQTVSQFWPALHPAEAG
jgi:hypothetical protein